MGECEHIWDYHHGGLQRRCYKCQVDEHLSGSKYVLDQKSSYTITATITNDDAQNAALVAATAS